MSREAANIILKAIHFILSTIFNFLQVALALNGIQIKLPEIQIPHDLRTAYHIHSSEPDIIRTSCCPKCYTIYTGTIPLHCSWRESPRARVCNTELWRLQNFGRTPRSVPKTLYNTQNFESWLHFFLSRRSIEDHLEGTFLRTPASFGQEMHDLQDSPAWKDLQDFLSHRYHLVFGLYIDWFNPYANKIAGMLQIYRGQPQIETDIATGKVVSCGAIILYCLNLPPEVRYFPENIFIVGLTPSPMKPDAVRLIHLLDPVIETILQYEAPGKCIITYRHANGVFVQTRVIPLIADLPAAREAGGFLSHSAECLCSFCNCRADQIECLDLSAFTNRTGVEVLQQAQAWHNMTTKVDRQRQATATGVRWTSLHRLPYRDPVRHTILGFMHNWLEGILQHQLRKLWGIGRDDEAEKSLVTTNQEEYYSQSDISESGDELEQLRKEAIEFATGTLDLPPSSPSASTESRSSTPTPRATPVPRMDISMYSDDEIDEPEDPDYVPNFTQASFDFAKDQLKRIQHCIQYATLPTWKGRPPINLGEKSHGKLKAHEYLTLFADFFTLIIPELWFDTHSAYLDSVEHKMLESFAHLNASTNIVASFTTSNAEAESYTEHYTAYRASIQQLYTDFASLPNHHYAMHNELLLKYWGPLAGLSEFPGERINGMLQKIKTNRHLCMYLPFNGVFLI